MSISLKMDSQAGQLTCIARKAHELRSFNLDFTTSLTHVFESVKETEKYSLIGLVELYFIFSSLSTSFIIYCYKLTPNWPVLKSELSSITYCFLSFVSQQFIYTNYFTGVLLYTDSVLFSTIILLCVGIIIIWLQFVL